MIFQPNIPVGATVRIPFSTHDGSGGRVGFSAAIDTADFKIYKDGSTVERSSMAGVTISETFDTLTGLHMLAIDLSDNTDAGFYAAGSTYFVALYPNETVDTQSVSAWIGGFSIGPAAVNVTEISGDSTAADNLESYCDGTTPQPVNATQIEGGDPSDLVNAACDVALSDYDAPTKAELDAGLAALNDPTAADIADAVLDEALAGHAGAGSLGKAVTDILADTGELQTDWADGGRLDLLVDAILADTGELQTDWANGGRLDLLIDAIKAKTDSLTFTAAGEVDANLQSINDVAVVGDGTTTLFGV